jgi:hypothetical protein
MTTVPKRAITLAKRISEPTANTFKNLQAYARRRECSLYRADDGFEIRDSRGKPIHDSRGTVLFEDLAEVRDELRMYPAG